MRRTPSASSARTTSAAALILTLLAGLPGCQGSANSQSSAPPLAGIALKLGVVDDPGMQAEIESLAGEWNARSGSELEVLAVVLGEAPPAVDVLIYPSSSLAELVERDRLAELPAEFVARNGLGWEEIWEPLRLGEATWGESRRLAVPLGSPVPLLVYRRDLFDAADLDPPATWEDCAPIAEKLAAANHPHQFLQPLGENWRALTLLARAAPYCRHRSHYSDLFDVERMEPLIDSPPFVRALEELAAAAGSDAEKQLKQRPRDVLAALAGGEGALGIAWLEMAAPEADLELADGVELGVVPLPGSKAVYNASSGDWEQRDQPQKVPLLAVSGRMGSVLKTSAHPDGAWELLAALTGKEWGPRISQASRSATGLAANQRATAAPRRTDPAARWLPDHARTALSAEYGAAQQSALAASRWMYCLRIPGRQDYLAALDQAVRAAASGKSTPQDALTQTAEAWREITEQHGRDAQRRAYQRSQGMIP